MSTAWHKHSMPTETRSTNRRGGEREVLLARRAEGGGGGAPQTHHTLSLQFVGTWEILGGVSDCLIFQSMKDLMKTSAAIVKVLPSGNMKLITGFPL